jgi:hypothetical protein
MKKLILILAFLLSPFPELFAQNQDNKLLIEEYLRQSENQRKAGIIMIGAGAGTAALGVLLAVFSNDWDSPAFGGGVILFVAGSASAIVGIPIIVSSASKARKAGQLSLVTDSARVINPNVSSFNIYPALKISVPLNSAKR